MPAGPPARFYYLAQTWDTDRGLPDYAVNGFAQTPDQYLWVQTFEGLARFDGARFELFNHGATPEFAGKLVWALLVDKGGGIWAATQSGINRRRDSKWQTYGDSEGKPITGVKFLVEGSDGSILAAADKRVLRFVGSHFEELGLPAPMAMPALFTTRNGDIWLYDSEHLYRRQDSTWVPIPHDHGLVGAAIEGVGAGRDGCIWLATKTGVWKLRNGQYQDRLSLPAGFRFSGAVRLLEDSDGNVWAGDALAGLLVFRRAGGVLRFTVQDGLSNLAIRALFEDCEKNIWVGTHGGGMIRFRRRAAHLFDDSEGLSEIMLDTVQVTANERVLVATYGGGISEFDPTRLRFRIPSGLHALENLGPGHIVASALEDKSGAVWSGVRQMGLVRIGRDGVTSNVLEDPSLEAPRSLFQDSQGTLWFGSESAVRSYQSGRFTRYDLTPHVGPVVAITEDERGDIWVGGPMGLFRRRQGVFELTLPDDRRLRRVTALYGSKNGLWIGAEDGGLGRLRDSKVTRYGLEQGLPTGRITSLIEDDQRRLWMATFQDGLFCVPLDSFDAVDAHKAQKLDFLWLKKEDGLGTNQFRSGYQPSVWKAKDGRLWFATLKGAAMVEPAKIQKDTTPPPVLIEAISVNGRRIDSNGNQRSMLLLPAGSRQLKFYFTAPSFVAPERVRFQYRLEGLDSNWVDTAERSVVLGETRPGEYDFQVRAAKADGVWSPVPAVVRFRVAAYVWEQWWFWLLTSLSAAGLSALGVYRFQRRRLLVKSEQLRVEERLRRDVEQLQAILKISEEKFSKAFDAAPNPFSIATLSEGRFVDVNLSFLRAVGLERESVIGATYSALSIWDGAWLLERLRNAIEDGSQAKGLEVQIVGKEGHVREWIVSAEVIELGGTKHLLVVSDDVTERRQMERQLSHSQKIESIGRLAGGVAHDFNNLLTVINGYSELLVNSSAITGEPQRQLQQIRMAGERARELTQQLLAFGRKQPASPRPLSLNNVVAETEGMLRRLLPETIEIVTSLDPELSLIMGDPGQMHQVILNLALNARDAMPSGGRLTMETANVVFDASYCAIHLDTTPGSWVQLAVTDTGTGMDESVKAHVFEPFFTTKGPGAGTGLGLATVHGVVHQNHGWIWVSSEPGKGTSFKIHFPRTHSTMMKDGGPAQHGNDYLRGTETILLVEDGDDVRAFAREVLESAGYTVLVASNGGDALRVAAQLDARVDLLVTDIVMPGMSARELYDHLRAERGHTKVLYMSGYTDDVIAYQKDLPEGVAFLQKPLTPERLLAKVRETLDAEVGI